MTRNKSSFMAAALTVACLATPVAPAAAGGSGGTRYSTNPTDDGGHVSVAFTPDGRRARAFISFAIKCSDGTEFMDWMTLSRFRVGPSGTFKGSFDTGPADNETATETRRWTGSFSGRRTRTQVTGTYRLTLEHVTKATGAAVTCDTGVVSYTATD